MQTDSHLFSMLGSKSKRNMHESAHQTIFCGTPCACNLCDLQTVWVWRFLEGSQCFSAKWSKSQFSESACCLWWRLLSSLVILWSHFFRWGFRHTKHHKTVFSVSSNPCNVQSPVPALGFSSATPSCNTFLSRTSMPRNAASFTIYLLKFSS